MKAHCFWGGGATHVSLGARCQVDLDPAGGGGLKLVGDSLQAESHGS